MCTERRFAPSSIQRGLTFVELIFFIASFGLIDVLTVLNVSSRSADPLVRKQLLAVAESVMEEVFFKVILRGP